jgi:hypothetical protein
MFNFIYFLQICTKNYRIKKLSFFQIWGKVEELSDRLNMWVSDGAMTAAASFNSRAVIRSIPVELFVFSFD